MTETLLLLTGSLDLTAAEGGGRRFDIHAYSGGKLRVDGFRFPVIVDLQGLTIPPAGPILIDHEKSVEATLGQYDKYENDFKSLKLAGPVTGTSDKAQRVLSAADSGHKWQASIGALIGDSEDIPAGQRVFVNGQSFQGPVTVARRALLRETSVLPMGADPTTSVNLAASAAGTLKGAAAMTFEQWLAQIGADAAKLSDADKQALMSAFETAMNPNGAPVVPPGGAPTAAAASAAQPALPAVAAAAAALDLTAMIQTQLQNAGQVLNATIASSMRRASEIQAKCAGFPQIAAAALENPSWSMEKVELEVLKASSARTRPTSFNNAENQLPQGEVLEAAICMNRKTFEHEKQYKPEILQAAHAQYRGRIGLQQVILIAAASNGYHDHSHAGLNRSNIGTVLRYATRGRDEQELQAAPFGTIALPGMLSNIANKEILTGYMEEDPSWQRLAKIKSVSDLKQVTSYRMLDDMEYEELGPGGRIKSGTINEESYTRQAKTYAKLFTLERTQILNDDLGAFDDLRDRIGRGSHKKLKKVFFLKFMNNSSFFTAGRGNYISGSTTNLGTDGVGLGLAVLNFRKMTSPSADGSKRIGVSEKPVILAVPPELEQTADKLYVGANLNIGSAAGEENTFRNKYEPVVIAELSDSNYPGYSTTAFYLGADPQAMPTMVVSFLDGVQVPTVEESESEFTTLGMMFRGYHDFGCDQAEYLGMTKSKGAA